jgi:hypothetical protein
VSVVSVVGHTLHDPEAYVAKCKGRVPKAYQAFTTLFLSLGSVPEVCGMDEILNG